MTTSTENTSPSPWPPNNASVDELQDAFMQAHSAVQWLARMVNSFTVPASDGSHLHMLWKPEETAIESAAIADDTVVEMRLPEMVLQFVEKGERTKHAVELDDKSPARIEAWTLIELLHRGIDRDTYSKNLPYDVSHLLGGDARDYETLGRETAFADMTDWMQHASGLISSVAQDAAKQGLGEAADVKFAPESFSLFVRIHPDNDRPAVGNFAEIGFCAGTSSDTSPHFYALDTRGDKREILAIDQIASKKMTLEDVAAFFAVVERLEHLKAG